MICTQISLSFSHFTWYHSQVKWIRKTTWTFLFMGLISTFSPSLVTFLTIIAFPTIFFHILVELSASWPSSGNPFPHFDWPFCLLPLFWRFPTFVGSRRRSSLFVVGAPTTFQASDPTTSIIVHQSTGWWLRHLDRDCNALSCAHSLHAKLIQIMYFSSRCRRLSHRLGLCFYCWSHPFCGSITSEFCLKQSIRANTPLELGSIYPSLYIVWLAILGTMQSIFYMFCIVVKNFPVAYPIVVSFQHVFWSPPLSRRSFSNKEPFSRWFCHCSFQHVSRWFLVSLVVHLCHKRIIWVKTNKVLKHYQFY